MHDVTEGGIFGALWEMAEASGVGLDIDLKKIPIRQETIEICEVYDINPYLLISSGAMLIWNRPRKPSGGRAYPGRYPCISDRLCGRRQRPHRAKR